MSDLGDALDDEFQAIEDLQTYHEDPDGIGDDFATEYEAFLAGVIAQLNAAAPDSIRNADGSIGAAVDNESTTTDELYPKEVQNTIHWIEAGSTATEINSIIAGATAGDTIQFPRGDWTVDGSIVDNGINDLTIRGAGMLSTTITVADNSPVDVSAIKIEGVTGWTISNLEIDANGANQTDGNANNNQLCIDAQDCSGLEVHHCRLKNSIYSNIRVQCRSGDMENVYIHHNHCGPVLGGTDIVEDNISLTSSDTIEFRDWRVSKNYCVDCPHQSIEISSLCNHGIVDGNIVVDNTGSPAITTHDGENVLVIGNTVRSTTGVGIHIDEPDSAAVGNMVVDSQMGIKLGNTDENEPRASAYNNILRNNSGGDMIQVYSDGASVVGNTLTGVGTNDHGIMVLANDTSIASNTILGGFRGIYTNVPNTQIIGNRISSPSSEGIFYRGSSGLIVGNAIDGVADYGMNINDGTDALIGMNSLTNNTTGITVRGTSADIRLTSNHFSGNTTDRDVAGGPLRITQNGVGFNAANDPASAGEWSGNGFQGLKVKWDDGAGTNYLSHYLNGSWYDIQLA